MWFEVDKKGLAKLLERKGKPFVLHELIQNALDEDTREITVTLERIPRAKTVCLVVEDDSPDGFRDLTHAFTLFAESLKKGDAEKRGRFNLGEKLVLALCSEATIQSTRGGVRFDSEGRHTLRTKRAAGTRFEGILQMTTEELEECHASVGTILIPAGKILRYNGTVLASRDPLKVIEAVLPTEFADGEGNLRATKRKTKVEIHEVREFETATLYEMGIPVVATGDMFHVNVLQKVPLNLDRDNVSPAYLAAVRAIVLGNMADTLGEEDANATWVKDALEKHGDTMPDDVVKTLVTTRFGDKVVAYDPSDPEANSRAVAAGYSVVHGGQLSKTEWNVFKGAGAIRPAGQVTPSPRPFEQGGRDLKVVVESDWTPGMAWVADLARVLARRLLGASINVTMAVEVTWPYAATYGPSGAHGGESTGGSLTFNMGRLGKKWFDGDLAPILGLIVHEFGHHFSQDHLSGGYHDALTEMAGKLAVLALKEPELFRRT